MSYKLKPCYFFYDSKNRLRRVCDSEEKIESRPFWAMGLFKDGRFAAPIYVPEPSTGLPVPFKAEILARMRAFSRGSSEPLRESGTMLQYWEFYDENWQLRGLPELKGKKITDFEEM